MKCSSLQCEGFFLAQMVMDNNRLVYDMEVGSIMSVAYAEMICIICIQLKMLFFIRVNIFERANPHKKWISGARDNFYSSPQIIHTFYPAPI